MSDDHLNSDQEQSEATTQDTTIAAHKKISPRKTTIRHIGIIVVAIGVIITLVLFLGVTSGLIGINFPKLTGTYAVGRSNYDLVDSTRQETFITTPGAKREIVITVYYPAVPPAGAKPAPYTQGKMTELLAAKVHLPTFALQLVHPHAYEHVPVAAGAFPVVLFSPGIGTPPLEYTSIVEDLASHGYIVAMIYHTYSVPVTLFADGRVATLSEAGFRSENEPPGTSDEQTDKDRNAIGAVWAADARFTLDQLTAMNSSNKLLQGHLDLADVGMFGHSFGGATTADVCQHDARFKACINMDGTAFSMTDSSQIKQPFMWMAADYSQVTDSMLKQIQTTRGEFNSKILLRKQQRDMFLHSLHQGDLFLLKGSTHSTYITDEALFGTIIPTMKDPLATIEGTRAVHDINTYVTAFFDAHLKGHPSPLLTGGPPSNSEIEFTVLSAL